VGEYEQSVETLLEGLGDMGKLYAPMLVAIRKTAQRLDDGDTTVSREREFRQQWTALLTQKAGSEVGPLSEEEEFLESL
jgi:hypothetical protein